MLRITALYPNEPEATFDFEYYTTRHLALFEQRLAPAGIRSLFVEHGTGGFPPGSPAPYICIFHAVVDDADKAAEVLAAHGGELMADVPHFTNVQPVLQFGTIEHEVEVPAAPA